MNWHPFTGASQRGGPTAEMTDVKPLVLDYLKAFDERDLERCLSFCNEDTTFHFLWRTFRGRKGIEKWHRDRFDADLRVLRVDSVSAERNTVTVDVIITSNKLKPHKVNSLGGRITVRLEHGALQDVKFGLRKLGKSGGDQSADEALYRSFVGPAENYDVVSAMQFNLLTFLGLRENQQVLDVGCGSLRAGRVLIAYLQPGRYFGIEPEQWLIEEGIRNETGQDLINLKRPRFSNDQNFTLTTFNEKFDFMLAQSVFSHAAQSSIRRCLSEAKKVMKPSAMFAATYFQGENYTGDAWVYPGFSTFQRDMMESLAVEQGLACKHLDWPHPSGQTWVIFTHRGAESIIPDLDGISKFIHYDTAAALAVRADLPVL